VWPPTTPAAFRSGFTGSPCWKGWGRPSRPTACRTGCASGSTRGDGRGPARPGATAIETRGYGDLAEAAARLQKHDPLLAPELARELAERGTARRPDGRLAFKHDPLHVTTGPLPFRVVFAAEFWRRITCPVLLVEGALSAFRHGGKEWEERASLIASTKRAVLAGAGHMMQRHQPATLADMLVEFLAR
jgi:pimeloyl-ACP methyl ester carboxylesterase